VDAAATADDALRTYCFGALMTSHICELVELKYFADGDAHEPGEETVREPWDDKAMIFEEFFTWCYGCLHTLSSLISC
jgi:hypothetical protein